MPLPILRQHPTLNATFNYLCSFDPTHKKQGTPQLVITSVHPLSVCVRVCVCVCVCLCVCVCGGGFKGKGNEFIKNFVFSSMNIVYDVTCKIELFKLDIFYFCQLLWQILHTTPDQLGYYSYLNLLWEKDNDMTSSLSEWDSRPNFLSHSMQAVDH